MQPFSLFLLLLSQNRTFSISFSHFGNVVSTPVLPAGSYVFMLEGTNDADLYIRIGLEPTESKYDCRPYKAGTSEVCKVTLASPSVIHGMVRGFAAKSQFDLVGMVD